MGRNDEKASPIKTIQVVIPILIGIAVVAWLFRKEFDPRTLQTIEFTPRLIFCLALAWVFMAGRDFGLSWRFRSLTDRHLTWPQALRVNFLCEFTSAITPSAMGGSTLGMLFMHAEGIPLGRATTLMLTTLFLDELFFVIACPVVMALIPYDSLFGFGTGDETFAQGLNIVFWVIYAAVTLWTIILFLGILVKPKGISNALNWLFRFRPLRRWQAAVAALGDNMVATSIDLRTRTTRWWIEAFAGTALTWISRYMVVNALFLGFAPYADQLVVFGRQLVVWITLMVSPTPGGSGVSEWLFTEYYGDMLANGGKSIALIIALFWRIISYYIYLAIGICILPGWIRRGISTKSKKSPE